jgi:pyrimidine deaminase RibD-like protein
MRLEEEYKVLELNLNHVEIGRDTIINSLEETVLLGEKASYSYTALSVGAVLLLESGERFSAYSREDGCESHAEELLIKRALGAELHNSICFTSVSPCLKRSSRDFPCMTLLQLFKVARVYFLLSEGRVMELEQCGESSLNRRTLHANMHHLI